MLKVFTDCSGIEAPIQALLRLKVKFKHVASSDIDKYCKQVSEAIYKPGIFYDDLMTRDNSKAPSSDIYIAGFPCQSFSIAGKRGGFDDIRGTVFYGCADYIREKQPPVFILENVKGLLSHDSGRTHNTIIELLSGNGGTVNGQMGLPYYDDGLGYHIYWKILNTKEHGIPQNRERWFCVGFKEPRDYRFPVPFPLRMKLKDLLESDVDEKYYLSDKAINRLINDNSGFHSEVNENLDTASTILSSDHKLARGMNVIKDPQIVAMRGRPEDNQTQVLKSVRTEYGEKVRKEYEEGQIKEKRKNIQQLEPRTDKDNLIIEPELKQVGSLYDNNSDAGRIYDSEGIACNQKSEGGGLGAKTGLYKVNKISDYQGDVVTQYDATHHPCISSQGGNKLKGIGIQENTSRIRRLTPLECLRLQDFPDSFYYELKKLGISDTQIYRMAGNSMSVNVITGVIKNILTPNC